MNALNPRHLKPLERRAELCRILALGLVRLKARQAELSDRNGEFPLHSLSDQSVHTTVQQSEDA